MQILVRTSDRRVLQFGQSIGAATGAAVEGLTDPEEAALRSVFAQPNGGITISADHQTITALPYVPPPAPVNPYAAPAQKFSDDRDALAAAYSTAGGNGVVQVNNQIQGLSALTLASTLTALKALSAAQQQFDEKLLAVLVDIRDHLAVLAARG